MFTNDHVVCRMYACMLHNLHHNVPRRHARFLSLNTFPLYQNVFLISSLLNHSQNILVILFPQLFLFLYVLLVHYFAIIFPDLCWSPSSSHCHPLLFSNRSKFRMTFDFPIFTILSSREKKSFKTFYSSWQAPQSVCGRVVILRQKLMGTSCKEKGWKVCK